MAGKTLTNIADDRPSLDLSASIFLKQIKNLQRLGRDFVAFTKFTLRRLQMARMVSVLASMSDEQLTQIGITRSDIMTYARALTNDEGTDPSVTETAR